MSASMTTYDHGFYLQSLRQAPENSTSGKLYKKHYALGQTGTLFRTDEENLEQVITHPKFVFLNTKENVENLRRFARYTMYNLKTYPHMYMLNVLVTLLHV